MIHRYATNIRFAGALPTSRSQSGNAFLECSVWLVSVWSATRKLKSVGVTSPFHQLPFYSFCLPTPVSIASFSRWLECGRFPELGGVKIPASSYSCSSPAPLLLSRRRPDSHLDTSVTVTREVAPERV